MTINPSGVRDRPWLLFIMLISMSSLGQTCDHAANVLKQNFDALNKKYLSFPDSLRRETLGEIREMFTFGYDCYMKCAFPLDELDPVMCKGRGPDKENPSNININDVLGDFSLTLIDTLDTLAIMGNVSEFQRAVQLVVENVSFEKPNTVQVFETNIRVLGGLLSAHLLMEDSRKEFGELSPDWYINDLLTMAHDLADRLLEAFQTDSGIPHPRVNLMTGVPNDGAEDSCTAGAGSLVIEMGLLSRLLGDPVYESFARKAVDALWELRSDATGLLGYVMNIHNKTWISNFSGLGAGMDSFYEYLLKSHILFGDDEDLKKFIEVYESALKFMRRGRLKCNEGEGSHPIYINVNMHSGKVANTWIDALQAAFPGLQVLFGDIEEAVCHHALYYAIWKKYGFLPERYNWQLDAPDVRFYPLRPEFVESTYFLYQATKNPFYLHVGRDVLSSIQAHARTNCGYGTIHDVFDKSIEDRQESFFLSETCKYLYLLFDSENPINKNNERYVFTTEGHVIPIETRKKASFFDIDDTVDIKPFNGRDNATQGSRLPASFCENPGFISPFKLPLKEKYLAQVFSQLNVEL